MHHYLFFLIIILIPSSLFGFNRTKTCLSTDEHAERLAAQAKSNAPTCRGNAVGTDFQWKSNKLTYKLHTLGISQFPGEQGRLRLLEEMQLSFEPWMDVDCSSLRFDFGGTTASFGHKIDEVNWIGFYDTQPWPWSESVVAITVVTTLPNGEIIDSDIEINASNNTIGFDGAPLDFDLRNLLTHEIGHFIGLDHSEVFDATMEFETRKGQIKKRDLDPDDVAGVCEIFPNDFVSVDPDDSGCCSTLRSRQKQTGWVLFSFLFIISIRNRFKR